MANPTRTILVVDSDQRTKGLVTTLLEELCYQVIEAEDARRALEIIADGQLDLAVVDLSTSHPAGHELCSQIKSSPQTELVPVIMLTKGDTVEEKVRAFEAGVDDFLPKPFTTDELRSRILAWMRVRELALKLDDRDRELQRLQEKSCEAGSVISEKISGTVVHQLRQPVSAIMLNTYLLEMMPKDDERFSVALEAVKSDAKRLALMIDNLRAPEKHEGDV